MSAAKKKKPTHSKRRDRGGRKVTTGRRVAGAKDARLRLSADEADAFAKEAKRAGKTVAAWVRDLGRSAAKKTTTATTKPAAWPQPFTRFAREVLGLTLTRGQSVLAKVIFDGRNPRDLEGSDRAIAREIFGGVDYFSPEHRAGLNNLRMGRGSGKTLLVAAYGIYRALTADLSACGPGDVAAVAIVSPRGKTSQIAVGYGREFASRPGIEDLVDSSRAEGFTLRRPDGRLVEFSVISKSRGGSALRGLSLVTVVIDESEFVPAGGRDAVVNDDDLISAAMPRMLPGALMLLVSTPWPAPSATSRAFEENYGHPRTGIAAKGGTLLMRDHDPAIAKRIELETARNPANAAREYACELIDGGGGAFFERSTIDAAISFAPIVSRQMQATAGVDPAFVNDSSALAIVERHDNLVVMVHGEIVAPEPHRPLVPSVVIGSFAATARGYGCTYLATDSHKIGIVRENALAHDLDTRVLSTEQSMIALREVLREGRLRIPNDPRLLSQLRAIQYRPRTGGGLTIMSPRTQEGHGDLVSALAMAVFAEPEAGRWERATVINVSSRDVYGMENNRGGYVER